MQILELLNKMYEKYIQKDENNDIENIFYIGGNDNLPPPLEGKEEAEAIEKLSTGSKERNKN